ncbi:MAG: type II toxin-antitoxin system Phd/YefM family antitoxin [Elusimicrobiota bacterium]
MKTVTVRDLRARTARVWKELVRDRELIVTSNGRPVAVLSTADAETVDETLAAFRQARASRAVLKAQIQSVRSGKDKLSAVEIEKEISDVRGRRGR